MKPRDRAELGAAVRSEGLDWLLPDWPAPPNVMAIATTRHGARGAEADFASEGPQHRASVTHLAALLPSPPRFLHQVHGTGVVDLDQAFDGAQASGDALTSARPGSVGVVRTADCLPVFFCDQAGTVAGIAHAGWRGLAAGVLEATVTRLRRPVDSIMAWLGPAIGPRFFEVGPEVRDAFTARDPQAAQAFRPALIPGKWLADLDELARQRLTRIGVPLVCGGGECTFSQPDRFHSYRRDGTGARMANVVWLAP